MPASGVVLGASTVYWGHGRSVRTTQDVTAGASLQQALRQVPRYTHNRYDRCLTPHWFTSKCLVWHVAHQVGLGWLSSLISASSLMILLPSMVYYIARQWWWGGGGAQTLPPAGEGLLGNSPVSDWLLTPGAGGGGGGGVPHPVALALRSSWPPV
jgi:hypothetical protein